MNVFIGDPVHRLLEVAHIRRCPLTFHYYEEGRIWLVTLGNAAGSPMSSHSDLESACESVLMMVMAGLG